MDVVAESAAAFSCPKQLMSATMKVVKPDLHDGAGQQRRVILVLRIQALHTLGEKLPYVACYMGFHKFDPESPTSTSNLSEPFTRHNGEHVQQPDRGRARARTLDCTHSEPF